MDIDAKTILAKAAVTVLKPLVRALIRNDVTHSEFAELVRQSYVDVAYEHYSIPGRKTTFSRVAVLTGLSRKEVVRLTRQREENQVLVKTSPNRAARVVNGWLKDAEFVDGHNKPRTLALQGQEGSFSALVARYSGDITLGAVLDELLRVGVVSQDDNDNVTLNAVGYVPQEDELEKIHIMSVCAGDLLDTAVHNLLNEPGEARFQRQIIHENVPVSVVNDFQKRSTSESSELLQALNAYLSEQKKGEQPEGEEGRRVGLGIYYFESTHSTNKKGEIQ